MYRLVKHMYCLLLNKNNFTGQVKSYAKHTSLTDKRTLTLGMPKAFKISDDDAAETLLLYMLDKEKYWKIAKKRFEIIEKRSRKPYKK